MSTEAAILSKIPISFLIRKIHGWYINYQANKLNKCPYFKELHHVSLSVDNLNEAIIFYRDFLKLTQIQRPGVFPFPGAWFLLPSGKQLHLVENVFDTTRNQAVIRNQSNSSAFDSNKRKEIFEYSHDNNDRNRIVNSHFAIRVKTKKDYDELRRQAIQRGLNISDKNFHLMEQLYIMDLSGNIIEISFFEDNGFMRAIKLEQ
jgi:catechol-2,3-dioxygenase